MRLKIKIRVLGENKGLIRTMELEGVKQKRIL